MLGKFSEPKSNENNTKIFNPLRTADEPSSDPAHLISSFPKTIPNGQHQQNPTEN